MTREENERLAVVEEQVKSVCEELGLVRQDVADMKNLLLDAMTKKADRSELDDLRKLVTGLLVSTVLLFASGVLGFLLTH